MSLGPWRSRNSSTSRGRSCSGSCRRDATRSLRRHHRRLPCVPARERRPIRGFSTSTPRASSRTWRSAVLPPTSGDDPLDCATPSRTSRESRVAGYAGGGILFLVPGCGVEATTTRSSASPSLPLLRLRRPRAELLLPLPLQGVATGLDDEARALHVWALPAPRDRDHPPDTRARHGGFDGAQAHGTGSSSDRLASRAASFSPPSATTASRSGSSSSRADSRTSPRAEAEIRVDEADPARQVAGRGAR